MIIDDGVSDRGHRENIMSTDFRYVGIGSRMVGDKIRVVMVFHSHDPTLRDGGQENHQEENYGNYGGQGNYGNYGGYGNNGETVTYGDYGNGGETFTYGNHGNHGNYGHYNQPQFQFDNWNHHNNMGFYEDEEGPGMQNFSGKTPVSTQTSTKTETRNGRTTTTTSTVTMYSDGST